MDAIDFQIELDALSVRCEIQTSIIALWRSMGCEDHAVAQAAERDLMALKLDIFVLELKRPPKRLVR